jgi:hypothetical protein
MGPRVARPWGGAFVFFAQTRLVKTGVEFSGAMPRLEVSDPLGPKPEKSMLHDYHTHFKPVALAFAIIMTLVINGSMLMRLDAMARESAMQITLPTVTVFGVSVTLPSVTVVGH